MQSDAQEGDYEVWMFRLLLHPLHGERSTWSSPGVDRQREFGVCGQAGEKAACRHRDWAFQIAVCHFR